MGRFRRREGQVQRSCLWTVGTAKALGSRERSGGRLRSQFLSRCWRKVLLEFPLRKSDFPHPKGDFTASEDLVSGSHAAPNKPSDTE